MLLIYRYDFTIPVCCDAFSRKSWRVDLFPSFDRWNYAGVRRTLTLHKNTGQIKWKKLQISLAKKCIWFGTIQILQFLSKILCFKCMLYSLLKWNSVSENPLDSVYNFDELEKKGFVGFTWLEKLLMTIYNWFTSKLFMLGLIHSLLKMQDFYCSIGNFTSWFQYTEKPCCL